jgi:hypothetical protein
MQTLLDFIVHSRENNSHSQAILESQYERLNKQCKLVYELLKVKTLTVREAMIEYGIGDLRRRCADLREKGINVKSEIMEGGFKKYYL